MILHVDNPLPSYTSTRLSWMLALGIRSYHISTSSQRKMRPSALTSSVNIDSLHIRKTNVLIVRFITSRYHFRYHASILPSHVFIAADSRMIRATYSMMGLIFIRHDLIEMWTQLQRTWSGSLVRSCLPDDRLPTLSCYPPSEEEILDLVQFNYVLGYLHFW